MKRRFLLFFDFLCDFLKILNGICDEGIVFARNVFDRGKKIFVFSEDYESINDYGAARYKKRKIVAILQKFCT